MTVEQNVLSIEGRKTEAANRDYLYQGISARHFKRTFNLADYVKVEGASFENGLLQIRLVREIPETMKPRRIPIGAATDAQIAETKKGETLLPGIVFQNGYATFPVPDLNVTSVQHLGRFPFGLFIIGAIQLVHAGNAPFVIKVCKRDSPFWSFEG